MSFFLKFLNFVENSPSDVAFSRFRRCETANSLISRSYFRDLDTKIPHIPRIARQFVPIEVTEKVRLVTVAVPAIRDLLMPGHIL